MIFRFLRGPSCERRAFLVGCGLGLVVSDFDLLAEWLGLLAFVVDLLAEAGLVLALD